MTNPRVASGETRILRAAITKVLMRATAPMPADEIARSPEVAATGLPRHKASLCVAHMYRLKNTGPTLHRIEFDDTRPAKYYLPGVLSASLMGGKAFDDGKSMATRKKPAPVNNVKPEPQEFTFNPVELEAATPIDVPVSVPPGVKCITLTVGGVSIKIELQ